MLWVLMLAFPFPYIATTAGWWTAELGRQPWIIYGLMRTDDAHSELVNPGDVVFTMLGFAGLYLLLGMLFVVQVLKEIDRGPAAIALGILPWKRSGSRSSRPCSRSTRCSTASTSASASSTASSPGPTTSGGPCWRRSARSGTATRSG